MAHLAMAHLALIVIWICTTAIIITAMVLGKELAYILLLLIPIFTEVKIVKIKGKDENNGH
jgi:hypothetical protein